MKQFFPVFAVAFSLLIARGSLAAMSSSPLEAIRRAPDPATVVAAYANASAQEANDPRLLNAYVSRMVDLGEPDMAYQQAESLKGVEPHNGLAWAVVAYADAHRGNMPEAITACERAALYAPDNRFVQQTAGGLLASYDRSPTRASLPPTAQESAVTIRQRLAAKTAFKISYSYATEFEQNLAASLPNQPGSVPPTNSVPMSSAAPSYDSAGSAAPSYDSVAPSYDSVAPSYDSVAPSYDSTAPSYGSAAPSYGSAAPSYGSATPSYDTTYAPQYVYPPQYPNTPQYAYVPDYSPWWGPPGYFYGSAVIPFGPFFVFSSHHGFHGHSYYSQPFHGYGFNHYGSAQHRGLVSPGSRAFSGRSFSGHGFAHSAPRTGFGGHFSGGGRGGHH